MSMDGQVTKWRRDIAENFNRLSRAPYSEREREFMFAKNGNQTSRMGYFGSEFKAICNHCEVIAA